MQRPSAPFMRESLWLIELALNNVFAQYFWEMLLPLEPCAASLFTLPSLVQSLWC